MNANAIANAILVKLSSLHSRVYRYWSIQTPTAPYIVFTVNTFTATDPSVDMYLNVDIYDEPKATPETIEDLADTIQNNFDNDILRTDELNLHFTLEARQYVSSTDLVTAQMINLRFVVRAYFK